MSACILRENNRVTRYTILTHRIIGHTHALIFVLVELDSTGKKLDMIYTYITLSILGEIFSR